MLRIRVVNDRKDTELLHLPPTKQSFLQVSSDNAILDRITNICCQRRRSEIRERL